jgi:hypothetical protein
MLALGGPFLYSSLPENISPDKKTLICQDISNHYLIFIIFKTLLFYEEFPIHFTLADFFKPFICPTCGASVLAGFYGGKHQCRRL